MKVLGRKDRRTPQLKGGTMVRRQTSAVRAPRARRGPMKSAPARAPSAAAGPRARAAEVRTRLDEAGHKLQLTGQKFQVAGQAATKFARSYVREVTTAAKASREPMHALWRNFRLAGRHIARDAAEMWHEMAPARRVMKLPVVRRARPPVV